MSPQVDESVEAASRVKPPACPRCGYDLRGITAVWREECPLEGTCSECGLAFEWSRVLHPEKFLPMWCIEYAHGPRAWWGTIRRLCLPWTFWRALLMTHPPRLMRAARGMLAMALIAGLALYLLVQISTAVVVYELARTADAQWRRDALAQQPVMVQRWQKQLDAYIALRRGEAVDPAMQPQLEHIIAALHRGPLVTVFEAVNRGEISEDRLHEQEQQFFQERVDGAKTPIAERMGMSMFTAVAEAVFLPLARRSIGTMQGGFQPYPAPIELHGYASRSAIIGPTYYHPSRMNLPALVFFVGSAVLGGAMLLNLFMPITLLLLVQTRKRTRLDPRHLARITIYTSWGLVLAVLGVIVLAQVIALIAQGLPGHGEPYALGTMIGFLALLFISWYTALGWYARIPHAFFVTVIHLVMSILFLSVILFVLL